MRDFLKLEIKIYSDRLLVNLDLKLSTYIDEVIAHIMWCILSERQCPTSSDEKWIHETNPYALATGLIMNIMICTGPDAPYAISIHNKYQKLIFVFDTRSLSRISLDVLKRLRIVSWEVWKNHCKRVTTMLNSIPIYSKSISQCGINVMHECQLCKL